MFLTEVRRHNDQELYAWACSLLVNLKDKGDFFSAHYLGYGQFTLDRNEKLISYTNTTIIFCFDYLLEDTRKHILEEIEKNKDARLIWIGAEKDPYDHPRITNIFWPADLLLQNKEYQKFDDVKKEPSNETHWISTSLGTRPHRIYMASLLKGMKLDRHGDLRIKTVSSSGKKSSLVSEELAAGNGNAPDNTPTLPLYVKDKWKLSKEIENISEESSKGYQELIKRKWWGSSLFLYSHYLALGWNENNNALNFDKNLRHLYKDKTLEVVNETMHGYNPIFVTEKFINAVIGLNLVIMNGPAGTVKLLEDLGWNSCRHVVNHDYDDITDPIMRCEQAIRFNSKLFSDPAYCNKVWQENLNILHDNSKWARDHLYNQILKNCEQQFKESHKQ
jgi:hypothetical protein